MGVLHIKAPYESRLYTSYTETLYNSSAVLHTSLDLYNTMHTQH
jgi:hypothetical protein